MGREIRRVPLDWEHPFDYERMQLHPLFDESYEAALAEYDQECAKARDDGHDPLEWVGEPPDPAYHRPAWPEGTVLGYQVYETVSEGTPLSPVFPDTETLITWLMEGHKYMPMLSRAAAERFIENAWAPSFTFVIEGGVHVDTLDGPQIYENH